MALSYFRMLINDFFNKDTDKVSDEAPMVFFDSKSDMCMDNNGKDTKYTRHIARRIHFVRNGEKYKMHNINWC